jgi:hypothetical protein
MNITNHARRILGIAVLAGSIAGAVGAAGATHADSTVPIDPVATEAPTEPITDEAPPGVDDSGVAATTTTAPASTEPATVPASTEPPSTGPDMAQPADDTPVTTVSAVATTTTVTPTDSGQQSLLASTPTAPLSVVATPGNQTVALKWMAPTSDGGATVDNYAVQQYDPVVGWKNVTLLPGLSYTVGGLTNGTTYSFRIRAHNDAGWSVPSAVVTAAPRTVPTAPLSVIASPYGSQTVWLYWNPPASDGGAPVIQYQIEWATSANGPWQFFATTTNKYYQASSAYWNNGTMYYFRILALNIAGKGAPSAVVSAIPRTVPSKPAGCGAWSEGPSYSYGGVYYPIQINWVAGSNGGVPITSYKVTVYKNGYYYTQGVTNVFLATSMHLVVWSHGNYTVTVQAGNSAGYGPACTATFGV